MKHLHKKQSIRGAGKSKPKPQAAVLQPPKLGGFKAVASFSVAEIIDLISDGPIEGLVDQNGQLLSNEVFKGVYLDNTPIQNTEKLNDPASSSVYGSVSIAEKVNPIARVWIDDTGNFKTINAQQNKLFSSYKTIAGARAPSVTYGLAEFFGHSGFAALRSLPLYWKLFNDKIEIHRASPLTNQSPIFNSFETYVKNVSNNESETSKKLADENIKQLATIKTLMTESAYGLSNPVGSVASSFIIIDLEEVVISALAGVAYDDKIRFFVSDIPSESTYTLIQPEISNGQFTGKLRGLIIIYVPLIERQLGGRYIYNTGYFIAQSLLRSLNSLDIKLEALDAAIVSNQSSGLFNFSNVSCQFKNGAEYQQSLNNFDKVFNDYLYESRLYGPFDKTKNIQRIKIDNKFTNGIADMTLTVAQSQLTLGLEGSVDARDKGNYSNWNDANEKRDYESLSVTHTIENPFVDAVSISIAVNSLSDTLETDVNLGGSIGLLQAGAKVPSIVAIRVETGKITNGQKLEVETYSYSIAGLIEGSCIIDFGSDYSEAENLLKDAVKIIEGDNLINTPLTQPFILPALVDSEEPSSTKRYIKVVKLSAETNSVLINKDVALAKVTEIINQRFSYPFSAIAGIKLDARSFGSIPERSYDCKLKKVKIPSNYRTQDSESSLDIRYVGSATNYTTKKQIYIGDWDGSFILGWTDNPAWILYDLLTSKRYGLGAYIDESQVNKWELYKIAKFCDAVDEEGYFVGVSNGFGGLEPRFSCNIMFKEQTKVYDAINVIANLFRGVVFFGGSEIHFLDDRPRTPIALFNNSNTKEGIFNYSNVRRDLQFNTVEVVYLDRFDNYKTKVEYIQDEQDIRKRGVFKTTINTLGVTSRAMARRIGQHIIYQTTKENQTVSFSAGLESLLCRPGDLIIVEDEMKTRASNYGRILEVDVVNKKLRIDNPFISGEYTGFITVYSPTGYSTNEELDQVAQTNRTRVAEFSMTNPLSIASLSGLYKFSGYTSGFNNPDYPSQFPLYTGTGSAGQKLFCYYNTGATGFVFSTGLAFQNNNTYDKIITNTGVFYGADISPLAVGNSGNYTGFTYNSAVSDKRGTPSDAISGSINWDSNLYPPTNGILDAEIDTYNISQITKMSLTGYDNTIDYGSFISLNQNDPNVAFLPAVKAGSVYRIERKAASDQIYKIISIRENSQNEYNITASRYDTGKFETIEQSITQDFLENTYYTGIVTVGNVQVSQVATPQIVTFAGFDQTPSDFKLTGRWTSGVNATGFNVAISNSLAGYFESTNVNQTGVQFTGLTNIGNWNLSVTALAKSPNINSSAATTGAFIAYSGADITAITKPAVVGFSIE
jgi:predicted phage tail protein